MTDRKVLVPKAEDELDKLKLEVAEELNLEDDVKNRGWENMTTREVGKIGGNMVRKMVGLAEKEMDRTGGKIADNTGAASDQAQSSAAPGKAAGADRINNEPEEVNS